MTPSATAAAVVTVTAVHHDRPGMMLRDIEALVSLRVREACAATAARVR
jgi:hypothetical protein